MNGRLRDGGLGTGDWLSEVWFRWLQLLISLPVPSPSSTGDQLRHRNRPALAPELDGDQRRAGSGAAEQRAAPHRVAACDAETVEAGDQSGPAAAVIDDDDVAVASE